jgi:beta-glucosidase
MSPSSNGFPAGFRFGVATAAYQIEGAVHEDGRGESIWDRFAHTPGAVEGGDTGDVACDHYHRWRADLDLMQALGVETYRFSIAWPRVLPDGNGQVNRRGVDFYRRIVDGLLKRGIEPIATLYHWDLPQALQDVGGWGSRETVHRFADYAALMADELGPGVSQWITHNEPWVVAFLGHAHGVKAPGLRDWPTALRVSHHLLLSHGLARGALRAALPDARIGLSLNLAPARPSSDSAEDAAAARRMDGYMNRWFLDPLFRGGYPSDMVELYEGRFGRIDAVRDGDLDLISQPTDFLGVNYYSPQRVRHAPGLGPLELEPARPEPPLTAMGWEIDPSGLHELLVRVRQDYGPCPIYITENGAAFDDPPVNGGGYVDDQLRTDYLRGHVEALRAAINDGVDVRRYCLWSLLDNFEWEHGYGMRFGIVHVDYDSQRRVPKRSGLWYRDYIHGVRNGDGFGGGN